jgi:hypothetical protein
MQKTRVILRRSREMKILKNIAVTVVVLYLTFLIGTWLFWSIKVCLEFWGVK